MTASVLDLAQRPGRSQLVAQFAQSLCLLTELPPELLILVLKFLGWRDILRVRKTCKHLVQVSKTKEVWDHLFRRHTASPPQILRLERPIETYTAEELEHLLLRWKSAEIGWRTDDGAPARKREIATEATECEYVLLVRGGRWLLVATRTGSVNCYDLEQEPDVGMPLIPSQIEDHPTNLMFMAVDIDNDSPFLTFNLGLSSIKQSYPNDEPPSGPKVHLVSIWRVRLVMDYQGSTKLSAVLLSSFPIDPDLGHVNCLSLLGHNIAFSIFSNSRSTFYTFVFDWDRARGSSFNYPRQMLHQLMDIPVKSLYLLPENRLIVCSQNLVALYNYSSVQETRTMAGRNSSGIIKPLWCTLTDRGTEADISPPYISSKGAQFILFCVNRVYGVTVYNLADIPALGCHAYEVKLVNLPEQYYSQRGEELRCIGYRQAIAVNDQCPAALLTYRWPDDESQENRLSPVLEKEVLGKDSPLSRWELGPLMDESSGRVVFSASYSNRPIILDFALIYKP